MNHKMMGRFIAQILAVEAVFMVPALVISLGYLEWAAAKAFLLTIAAIAAVAGLLFLIGRKAPNALDAREGMVCVGLSGSS